MMFVSAMDCLLHMVMVNARPIHASLYLMPFKAVFGPTVPVLELRLMFMPDKIMPNPA
jgi:hypothetical protein